ncbi:eCIS core domain-containing protein [Streptomyces phaeofaciens]|uniref:eCIS core domain-containing protein n=1 Tax=Streptomyces phaeofaciens TaxID=68254 RepID=UPI0036A62CFB
MRAQRQTSADERGQDRDRRAGRGGSPTVVPGRLGGMSSGQALALQRSAGNAATARALREERKRPATERPTAQTEPAQATVQRSSVHQVLKGAGQPLDAGTRADMEARLGADFSDVRLHTGSVAQRSAAEIGARAYTSGSHIVLGAGGTDRHTLAHELTHVIQQRRGPVTGTDHGDGLSVSDPSDRFEREAEANAARALSLPAGQAVAAPAGAREQRRTPTDGTGTAQRMWNGQAPPSNAQLARDQQTQMQYLPALYVPAEAFGVDGSLPALPTHARTTPFPGAVDILQMNDPPLPAVAHRNPGPRPSWPLKYQSGHFIYRVEMVNDPSRTGTTLVNPDQPFRIVRRTLKMRQSGASAGRTYRFAERWSLNPAHWNLADFQEAARAEAMAQQLGLDASSRFSAPDMAAFTALPTDADQPFVFYVSSTGVDPHFQHADGTAKNERRYRSATTFDNTAAAGYDVTGLGHQGYTALSSPPQVDRRSAGRDPSRAMGRKQAHELMGDEGRKGSTGERLASHEWCHLVGDGDGGPDLPDNLVIGTNAVNTEQLAMETALRPFVGQLAALGHSIQLRVQVLLGSTDEDHPQVPNTPWNLAEFISYDISLVPRGRLNAPQPHPVHRQIMDGRRGTITELEFTYLNHLVRAKLREVTDALQAQQQAPQAAYAGAYGYN